MKKIFLGLLFLLMVGCSYSESKIIDSNKDMEIENNYSFLNNISNTFDLNTFTIYGRYFNISTSLENVSNPKLVLKNDLKEIEYDLIKNDNIYKTNKLINEGINLENIEVGDYIILIKDNDNYYNLKNNSEYKDLIYYTITKNNINYKITIEFIDILDNKYLTLKCTEVKLPDNIYDIIIDPGHGGKDSGAVYKNNSESKINLEYSLLLKEKLEKLGLKVNITRDKDIEIPNYGSSGRVTIPYKTKGKMMLSIHLNSSDLKVNNGGVEIYAASNSNINFAKNLSKNIVSNTSTIYSKNTSYKVFDGVYIRTFSKKDLEELEKDAIKDNFTPYETPNLQTTYYYIIRETGGIITNAYIDNRNPKKEGNPYYLSNHGCETYLVELGYINSDNNLKILLNEKDKYIDAIVNSIKEEFKLS